MTIFQLDNSNIINENRLKEQIRSTFSDDFYLYEEEEGQFLFEGERRKVIADFLLKPKPNLVADFDFPDRFFVIETKFINSISVPDLSNLFIQCLTYKNSDFRNSRPFGVFHFTDIEYSFDPPNENSRMLEVLSCTFGRLNIGRVIISGKNFNLIFHKGDCFFQKKTGQFKKAKRDLLNISFGSGNNKLVIKY